jgi:hypothetical protein
MALKVPAENGGVRNARNSFLRRAAVDAFSDAQLVCLATQANTVVPAGLSQGSPGICSFFFASRRRKIEIH